VRDQTMDPLAGQSRALAEPTNRVSKGWIAGNTLASLGLWMASVTSLSILIPEQLQHLAPKHKVIYLGIVAAIGALAAGIATPLVGALSDSSGRPSILGRRFSGRRHRWTLGAAALGAVVLVLLGLQTTVPAIMLLWFVHASCGNAEYASLTAAIPDHVPVRQRATVAGWVAMPLAAGLVVGTLLVTKVVTSITGGYLLLAVLLLTFALPFVLFTPDPPLPRHERVRFSWRGLLRSYWLDPRRHPDFGWAWLTRFLAALGNSMGTLYLLYYLRDAIHYPRLFPGHTAASGLLILVAITATGVCFTAIIGGIISDRIGRRKIIVSVSGIMTAFAAMMLGFWQTWSSALIAATILGIGYGAYVSVDQALMTEVLPSARDRAKDLGILNIAIVAPTAIGAAISAPIVYFLGYQALYAVVAVVTLSHALLVWKIKSVP
jgi:MFS family permease